MGIYEDKLPVRFPLFDKGDMLETASRCPLSSGSQVCVELPSRHVFGCGNPGGSNSLD